MIVRELITARSMDNTLPTLLEHRLRVLTLSQHTDFISTLSCPISSTCELLTDSGSGSAVYCQSAMAKGSTILRRGRCFSYLWILFSTLTLLSLNWPCLLCQRTHRRSCDEGNRSRTLRIHHGEHRESTRESSQPQQRAMEGVGYRATAFCTTKRRVWRDRLGWRMVD